MNDYNNKTVDGYVDASQGFKVNGSAPSGKVLMGNGTAFVAQDPPDGGGTVTSVALSMPGIFSVSNSPVTGSGTLTVTFATQTANRVLAGPTTGSAAAPTFRALVEDDLPTVSWSKVSKTGSNLTDLANREFADLQNKPTTLSGYGITDAASDTHTHSFAALTSKPTTLSGYGITDAASDTHTHSFSSLTSKPTTLSGYGITDAESSISAGTTGQYWRGDKSWQTLNKAAVGLSSVENTALSTWAGSANVTQVGTVTSGTWNGSVISSSYIGSHTHSASDITSGTLPIGRGGTGQTTANAALNALLPSQSGKSGKALKSDGSNASWEDDATGGGGGGVSTHSKALSTVTPTGVLSLSLPSSLTGGSIRIYCTLLAKDGGDCKVLSWQDDVVVNRVGTTVTGHFQGGLLPNGADFFPDDFTAGLYGVGVSGTGSITLEYVVEPETWTPTSVVLKVSYVAQGDVSVSHV